jgi:protein-disulfide isomerase
MKGVDAQAADQASSNALERKIELFVRSQFSVPAGCNIEVGPRMVSAFPGYDGLSVKVSQADRTTELKFLITTDGKTLARLEKFDLGNYPPSIDVRGRPIRGNPAAPVTVVSFDDLECPVCAYMHQILFPTAANRYGDAVRFIYKDNPLVEMHPWALHAAVDATCLADQSPTAYWSYVDTVHARGQEVSGSTRDLQQSFTVLDRMAQNEAQRTDVDASRLQACIRRQDEAPVRRSMKEAAQLGLNFTPALFVNGEEIRGFTSEEDIWTVIDRAVRETGKKSSGRETVQRAK